MPSQYMVLDRDLFYVEANDAYCASTERPRDQIVGRYVFEVFPQTGADGGQIEESLRRVLQTGVAETLPLVSYPIPNPSAAGYITKYWSCVHTPLFDADGQVAYVAQNAVDVTELQHLKTIAYGANPDAPAIGESALFQRAQQITEINRSLTEEMQGLRELFTQAPGFMAVLTGPDLTFAMANNAYLQLIGHRQVVGRPLLDALPEVRGQGFLELLVGVMRNREPFIGQALSVTLQRTPDGPPEERFCDFIYQPIIVDGEAVGVFVEGSDVTDRVVGERQQKLLLDELNHRAKNTLATVQAIADQTLRTNPEPDAFRRAFEARLMALSATHNLLTATSWRSARLRDVAQQEFRPYGAERYQLAGPDVELPPGEALALGMLFHELATNAAKHGALSGGEGVVQVAWRVDLGVLTIEWTERGGPPVAPPTRRGFGSRLIERSLKGPLSGEATLNYAPEGVRCHIRLPLAA